MWVAGGGPADIVTAASTATASHTPLLVPPTPPPRRFLGENNKSSKTPSETLRSIVILGMETIQDASPRTLAQPPSSSSPLPVSKPDTSSPPLDLPPSPEFYPSSSPPPPPPPPSYLFPELSSEDLPPPPPAHMLVDVSTPPPPLYICCYDPPSPEIKSVYDPQLPPGFSSKSQQLTFSPLPPPVPPPPRPSPPPPPTPPVRQASSENLAVHLQPSGDKFDDLDVSEFTTWKGSESNRSSDGEYHKHIENRTPDDRSPSSIMSSSTLTATFLQTPESGMSPLPPHALRVSPVPTDDITPSSQTTEIDDFTMTPTFSDVTSTPNFYDNSKTSALDMDTPEAMPQLSETPGTPVTSPAFLLSLVPTKIQPNTLLLPPRLSSPTTSEISPHSLRSECSLQRYDSESDKTNNALSERSDFETLVGPNTATTTTAGQAQILSPVSTELPSLFSLPTDSDTISADFDYSFAADTLSPSGEFDSFTPEVETFSSDKLVTATTADVPHTSPSPGFSDTAYATADSALGSATMSPSFTESCTITPLPADYFTPISTNPSTTPIPSPIATEALSPIPSSPLPYFDAYPPIEHMPPSPSPTLCSPSSNKETTNISVTSSQGLLHCETSNEERLVRYQTSETIESETLLQSSQVMLLSPLATSTITTPQHTVFPTDTQNPDLEVPDLNADEQLAEDKSDKNDEHDLKGIQESEEKQNSELDYTDQMTIKQSENEITVLQTKISLQKDSDYELLHMENEPNIGNVSQKLKNASFEDNDSCEQNVQNQQINRTCEHRLSSVHLEINDMINGNMRKKTDSDAMNIQDSEVTKENADFHVKTEEVPSKQMDINQEKMFQDESQESTQEIYEVMEDVNGNLSYVLEDKLKATVSSCETKESNLAQETKDDKKSTQGILGNREKEISKPPETLNDEPDNKDSKECICENKCNEVQNEYLSSAKVKIPKANSLPVLLSASLTPPRSPASGWTRSSLPSSPTPRSGASSQSCVFSRAIYPLKSKSMSVPSSPVPYMSASVGGSMYPRKDCPSYTPRRLVSSSVPASNKIHKTSSLSASPEEPLQLLNAVVADLENITAGLPASCPKQMRPANVNCGKLIYEDSCAHTAEKSLQVNTVCLDSETREASVIENLIQEDTEYLYTESDTISRSESCALQHPTRSLDREAEVDATYDSNLATKIPIISSHELCEGKHTRRDDTKHKQTCVSSVTICLVASPPENSLVTRSPQPPLTSKSLDDAHSDVISELHSDMLTQSPVTADSYCNRIPCGSTHNASDINLSSACSRVNVSPVSSAHCKDNIVASTNTDTKGEIHTEYMSLSSDKLPKVGTMQKDEVNVPSFTDHKHFVETSTGENVKVLDLETHVHEAYSPTQSSLVRTCFEYTPESHLCSENSNLEIHSVIDDTKSQISNDCHASQSSSPFGSIVEDVASPWPVTRARSPPPPPPRSGINTPRPATAAPLPPPRQYILVPINQTHGTPRRFSPPPAPPRSTSIRKSPPPPPPPRSVVHTPAGKNEWLDFPPLPPPPTSCINTPITPPLKLTPVPEESSSPTTPLPSTRPSPRDSQAAFSTIKKSLSKINSSLEAPDPPSLIALTLLAQVDEKGQTGSLTCNTRSQSVSSVTGSTSFKLNVTYKDDPPAVPPPPVEDYEEPSPPPPPPPPPPLEESEVEPVLPLPLPPDDLPPSPSRLQSASSQLPPPPPPPNIIFSNQEDSIRRSVPFPAQDALSSNSCSIPPSESETTPSMFMPTSTPQPAAKVPAAHSQFMPDLSSSATSSSALSPHSPTSLNKNISASPVPSTSLTSSAPLPPRPPSPKPGASGVTKSPLITTSPYGKIVIIRSDLPLPPPEEEIRSTFANIKDWGILEEEVDTLSIYTQLRPVIQQGPQCGIVALSMASQVFPETVEVPDLLQAAKKQGYSCHGEMFSCDAMTKLAGNINGMEATVCRDVLCNPRRVLELIMQGDLILVPYDAERNYMPGLRSGHKAHWGVICGCLVQCQSLNMYMGGASKLDSHVDNLWHLRPRSRVCIAHLPKTRDGSVTPVIPVVSGSPNIGCPSLRPLEQPATDDDSDICKLGEKSKEGSVIRSSEVDSWSVSNSRVNTPMLPEHLQDEIKLIPLWRQGKSRKLVASSLEQLRESNDQLVEYPPATTVQEEEYIIESVQDGLAGQVVVLHKTKTALSDLVGLLQETKSC